KNIMKKYITQSELCKNNFKNCKINEALFNAKWVEIITRAEKIKTLKGINVKMKMYKKANSKCTILAKHF
uniref:hypothetical protein n=1 Tax=Methanobrevibacter sp. TaxID=66852 RepID=UPI003890AFD1